jgi:hypothetical protein
VLPLHKGRDSCDLNNYRPISRLPCLVKILECTTLLFFLSEKYILNVNQSGFRPGHSTISVTTFVLNDLVKTLDTKMKCATLLVDLSKSFDTVDHAILLNKLTSIGLSYDTCSWFHDYLSDRTLSIVVDGVKSEFLEVHKGVPQGLILGPILFTIYNIPLVNLLKIVNLIYMRMILLCRDEMVTGFTIKFPAISITVSNSNYH